MSQRENVAQTTLSERLASARSKMRLSMRELSRKSGVDVGYISRIEQGCNDNLGFEKASALASVLSVSVDWLLSGHENVLHRREISTTTGPNGEILQFRAEESGNKKIPLPSDQGKNDMPGGLSEAPLYEQKQPLKCQGCEEKEKEILFLREALQKALDRIPKT